MDAGLTIKTLNRAPEQRQIKPAQLLIHADRNSQYEATDYRELLQKYQITCGMSAKSCCRDKAVVESLFSTLKPGSPKSLSTVSSAALSPSP